MIIRVVARPSLRVRTAPDTAAPIVARLAPDGRLYEVTETVDDAQGNRWGRIWVELGQCWIALRFAGQQLVEIMLDPPTGNDVYIIKHRDGKAPGIGWNRGRPPYLAFPRLSAVYETVPLSPRPGHGKIQVVVEQSLVDFVDAINGHVKRIMNYIISGKIIKREGGSKRGYKYKFPIIAYSGNYARIAEIEKYHGQEWGRFRGLPGLVGVDEALSSEMQTMIHRMYVVWRNGRISDTPQGIVRMPVIEPAAFSNQDKELWISMDALSKAFP